MRPDAWPVAVWGVLTRGWAPSAARSGPLINPRVPDLVNRVLRRDADSARGASIRALIQQVLQRLTIGMSIRDHDVSGTGRQTANRGMESITTMTPARQCGHSRNVR